MEYSVWTLLCALFIIYLLSCIVSLRRNYLAAASSGLKCIVVPFHLASVPWVAVQPAILPILTRLPLRWTSPWLPFLSMDRCWSYGHDSFAGVGADTFIAVSIWGNMLHTCEPEATTQFFRANDFEKPASLIRLLNIFGPTMTGTERQETRGYRKIAAPFFNEASMKETWDAAAADAQALGQVLIDRRGDQDEKHIRATLAKMTLHVVNRVCFGAKRDVNQELNFNAKVEPGHEISYSEAMHTVMENLRELYAIPRLILRLSFKKVLRSYLELDQYLEETMNRAKYEPENSVPSASRNLLDRFSSAEQSSPDIFPKAAFKGNIFIFMFAGHEANANTMSFLLVLMAMHPKIQRDVQSDIDRLQSNLTYPAAYDAAMTSLPGAVINEALRLYTVIPFILKATWSQSRSIKLQGKACNIPPDTLILMHTNATHRNPKYWPEPDSESRGTGGMPYPIAAFNPYQWLSGSKGRTEFLNPAPGAFFPFSEGNRGCLGKKFALVELCATLCHLLAEYSVELVVDGINDSASTSSGSSMSVQSKPEARNMDPKEMKSRWEDARQRAEYEMSAGVEFNMSLRLTGEVLVRFVPRGQEVFKEVV